jgi:hypothetical protein
LRVEHGRGRSIAALGLGVALVLGACSTDRKLTQPKPVPVTEERLQGTLLTTDDLPDGFTVAQGKGTPIGTEVLSEHDCDDGLKKLKPKLQASTDFTGNDVELVDTSAWFPGQGPAVEQVFREVAAKCAQVVATDAGVSIRTGALDFGVLSDDTVAIRFEIEPRTGAITERDLILRREGDLVHVIRLTGPRPSDKALLDTAVRATIGRLGLLYQDTT